MLALELERLCELGILHRQDPGACKAADSPSTTGRHWRRRKRWLSLPSQCDQATMSLSSAACPMMLCVRDHLLNLQQLLCAPLFQAVWQGLADRLDNFLYQDVAMVGGASEHLCSL
ncbi:hypothetical protein CRUP_028870 [Coryphaenoides rupestris]|nr:hypothetical protein CRUP_028870 [Coryphaenoides rupestris]